jgi:hypothetical protein
MKNIIVGVLCAFLIVSVVESADIVKSDLQGEQLKNGDIIMENTHDYGEYLKIPGAKLIWDKNWNNSKNGMRLTFIEHFKTFCDSPVHIEASADN